MLPPQAIWRSCFEKHCSRNIMSRGWETAGCAQSVVSPGCAHASVLQGQENSSFLWRRRASLSSLGCRFITYQRYKVVFRLLWQSVKPSLNFRTDPLRLRSSEGQGGETNPRGRHTRACCPTRSMRLRKGGAKCLRSLLTEDSVAPDKTKFLTAIFHEFIPNDQVFLNPRRDKDLGFGHNSSLCKYQYVINACVFPSLPYKVTYLSFKVNLV